MPPGTRSVSSAYAGGDPVVFVLRNDIQTCLPLHRKKNLEAVGGWRPDLPCAQEFDLHLRLACSGCGLHHVPEVLCGVRTVPGSVSDNYLRVLDQFPRILEPAYASLKDAGRLSEERAKTFALVMARAARHYLQRGEPAKAETCFRSARRMHPDGGITGVYNRPARFLRRALGPMAAERLVAFKRAHVGTRRPDPSGPKESAGRAVREGPVTALLILHGFPPSHHSGTLRNTAVARYLPDSGVRPVIFCAADDDRVMPYGRIEDWTDDRRWIEVRRMPWCLTAPDATSLDHRLQLLPVGWTVAHRRARRRVLDRVQAEAGELLRRHRPDVIYASSPPVETLLLAARLAEEYGVPYVCDLRDPWTCDSWIRYRHGLDFAVERNLERSVLSRAAAVIANTPTARRLLVEEIGIPEEKVAIIPNGYDEGEFGELPPRPASPNDRFLVAYTGILSTFRPHVRSAKEALKRALGVDYQPIGNDPNTRSAWWFLEAVGSLLDDRPDLRRRLDIVFAGAHS